MSQALKTDAGQAGKRSHKMTTPVDSLIVGAAYRIGGARAKEIERFIKFACVGLLGFIIDSGSAFILQNTLLPPLDAAGARLHVNVAIATTIAFFLAVCSNFVWNRLWTYPDSRSRSARSQLTQFAIVSVIGWIIRTIWIVNTYEPLAALSTTVLRNFSPDYAPELVDEHKLGTLIALFFGVIVVMLWNFLANRYWTYNDVD